MKGVKKVFARQSRKDQTRAEKIVWEFYGSTPNPFSLWEKAVNVRPLVKEELG